MSQPMGIIRPIGLAQSRRLQWIAFSDRIPLRTVRRTLRIDQTVKARKAALPTPSWLAIVTKAYAQTAIEEVSLRQAFLTFPWSRIYEHPVSVASVEIPRPDHGLNAVTQLTIPSPENVSLVDLDILIRRSRDLPLKAVPSFQSSYLSKIFPSWVTACGMGMMLAAMGYRRSTTLGTFTLVSPPDESTTIVVPRSPLTSTLQFGSVNNLGEADVVVSYDPRLMVDRTITNVLATLERVLNNEIVVELRYLQRLNEAA